MNIIAHLDFLPMENRGASTTQQRNSQTAMLALLFYAYASGAYSSQKLAQAIQRDITFRLITAGTHPDHSLISSFRRRFRKELETLFVEIMEVVTTSDPVNQHIEEPYKQSAGELLHSNVVDFFERAEQGDVEEVAEPATRHLPCSRGNRKTEKNTRNKDSRTYTFLSTNDAIPALTSVTSQKSTLQWLTARRTGGTPARLPGSLFRSYFQQPHLGKSMGTILLMLIPVVFVALILTHNAPHSILTRSDSAAETHHLTAPALETPSRETGNIVSSNTGPDQTTPAVNKLTFAAPEKSASPVPDPVIETDTGTETGTREVVTALPEGPEQGTLIHRGDWLLKQPPGHYMLQLLATRNEILLLQLLAENHPGGLVAYYKDHIKARDWYILLYGKFSTRQTALDAIGSLPKEYQGNHPWPRSLASVQAILLRQRDRTAR
jgi:hypothetical protein